MVVPSVLQQSIIDKLHASHIGIQGCVRRAREAFYWPGMNNDITEYISKCSTCNSYRPEQQTEPMICHALPARPWQSIAVDLFEVRAWSELSSYN